MNNTINHSLTQFLELIKTDLINSLQAGGKSISGQTLSTIEIIEGESSVKLSIPGYLQLLETGRRPTGKNPVPGNPPMIQRIQHWCLEKGIPEKAAWAIKKSIDKNGYKGIPGIISGPLSNDNLSQRLNPLMENIANELVKLLTG